MKLKPAKDVKPHHEKKKESADKKDKGKDKEPDKKTKPKLTEAEKAAKKARLSAANTRAQKYIAVFRDSPNCEKDREKIEKRCKPKEDGPEKPDDPNKPEKKPTKLSRLRDIIKDAGHAVDTVARDGYKLAGARPNDNNAWMDDHCGGLWAKPGDVNVEKYKEEFTSAIDKLKDARLGLIKDAFGQLVDVAKEKLGPEVVTKKLVGLGARSVIKEVGAGITGSTGIGMVISVGLTAWTVADAYQSAVELAEAVGPEGLDMLEEITTLKSLNDKADELLDTYKTQPMAAVADAQALIARLNACVRARRCKLVTYKKSDSAINAAKSGEGCCPGQTGHHLLPEEMFEDCPAYEAEGLHRVAPTVCAEGVNNEHGSHGILHKFMDKSMALHQKETGTDEITNDKAIDAGAKSFKMTFPGCNDECIKEQLKAFYSDICQGKLKPRGGLGSKGTSKASNAPRPNKGSNENDDDGDGE